MRGPPAYAFGYPLAAQGADSEDMPAQFMPIHLEHRSRGADGHIVRNLRRQHGLGRRSCGQGPDYGQFEQGDGQVFLVVDIGLSIFPLVTMDWKSQFSQPASSKV